MSEIEEDHNKNPTDENTEEEPSVKKDEEPDDDIPQEEVDNQPEDLSIQDDVDNNDYDNEISDMDITEEIQPQPSQLLEEIASKEDEGDEVKPSVLSLEVQDQDDDGIEFIKHPTKTNFSGKNDVMGDWNLDDDFMGGDSPPAEDELSLKATPSLQSIHISSIIVSTHEEARELAEKVIETLEEDVFNYLKVNNISLEGRKAKGDKVDILDMKNGPQEKESGSSISISSNVSDPLPGQPSTLRLFYAKGKCLHRYESIPHIPGVDKGCEANFHRSRRLHRDKVEGLSQTKEMTFVSQEKAQLVFMQLYRKPDDWTPPRVPSRANSLDLAVKAADEEDPHVDRARKGPQIVNFSNRKKLLQPLREDYYKDETFWTGSRFRGEYKNRQFHKGHYDHPTGVKYESEWKDGHFHTSRHLGVMEYPRGDTFEGEWHKGRYTSGQITFGDGLQYKSKKWSYCEPPDRRLRIEKYYGMKPAGNAIYNDQYPAPTLPPGCYDVGDGVFNVATGEIRGYDGFLLRTASPTEQEWILKYCRRASNKDEKYIPSFHADRIPGSYMEQLQRFSMAKRKYH